MTKHQTCQNISYRDNILCFGSSSGPRSQSKMMLLFVEHQLIDVVVVVVACFLPSFCLTLSGPSYCQYLQLLSIFGSNLMTYFHLPLHTTLHKSANKQIPSASTLSLSSISHFFYLCLSFHFTLSVFLSFFPF